MNKVTVIGLGYIGLPTSLFFAKSGYEVIGVDVNEKIVKELSEGRLTFEEPGMERLFIEASSNIKFSQTPKPADLFIITVPTPFLENKTIDEKYIDSAFESIKTILQKGNSIVLESTVPPLVTEKLAEKIKAIGFIPGVDIHLGHVPETIIPGNMVHEFVHNKRLIGGFTIECSNIIAKFYEPIVKGEILKTDLRTAEFVKVIENTYRDVNIALSNELMRMSDKLDIDVYEAIDIANRHPRVNLHSPGGGVGGHCISVDPWFLVGIFGDDAKIVGTAREINDSQPRYIFDRLNGQYDLKDKNIGIYGLAYKPDIDDFRESPSFTFIDILKEHNYTYKSFDPHATTIVEENQILDFDEFVSAVDGILVYVNHSHIKEIEGLKLYDIKGKLL